MNGLFIGCGVRIEDKDINGYVSASQINFYNVTQELNDKITEFVNSVPDLKMTGLTISNKIRIGNLNVVVSIINQHDSEKNMLMESNIINIVHRVITNQLKLSADRVASVAAN